MVHNVLFSIYSMSIPEELNLKNSVVKKLKEIQIKFLQSLQSIYKGKKINLYILYNYSSKPIEKEIKKLFKETNKKYLNFKKIEIKEVSNTEFTNMIKNENFCERFELKNIVDLSMDFESLINFNKYWKDIIDNNITEKGFNIESIKIS